ncbi:MAG TPA: L-threonylcarbamoyladenylate synthase [Clostridia bacterium]|nr:L-threonylcarbamoyladenylate synthase [Clostridia bacterium]
MDTRVYKIEDIHEDYKIIKRAASLIKEGQVVAFPTETVYGLGANALDGQAVERIFKAKGRPGDNPLIVHIANRRDVEPLVLGISPKIHKLMEVFWPGPLTIILKKNHKVPSQTTAGLDTVALRMPGHPIALALIQEAGVPIAAPSANRSGKPSPTRAQHVVDDLCGRIPMILDGGEAQVGLESTVLDMSGSIPTILRPGGVTLEMLRVVIDDVIVDSGVLKPMGNGQSPKSPGMKYTHYAPRALVTIVKGSIDYIVESINKMANKAVNTGQKVGVMATDETCREYEKGFIISLGSRKHPSIIGANLFSTLRQFDEAGVDIILAEWIDEEQEGLAIMDRMIRAAGFRVIN